MAEVARLTAGERVQEYLARLPNPGIALAVFDEALAAERRATVERLRERMLALPGVELRNVLDEDSIYAILDEEAARG